MQIADRNFLVTGGASGLGAACARRLVEAGGRVVIADVNQSEGESLANKLGAAARFALTDVTDADSVAAAVALARRESGEVHGAINCAGIIGAARLVGRDGPHDLELFTRVIGVNLIGTFNVLRLAAAAMMENVGPERGVIVNTSSIAAFEGQIGQVGYSASKGAVASMTLPAARELGRHGIRVVAIAPGVFDTPMMQSLPESARQQLADHVPFPPQLSDPQDFAALALHILENPTLNGTVIRLDGGLRMPAR